MDVSILLQVALSCGVVLLYSVVGNFFLIYLVSEPSNDALHLLRLTNAFCPPRTEPSIFGRDVNNPRENSYYSEDGLFPGQSLFKETPEFISLILLVLCSPHVRVGCGRTEDDFGEDNFSDVLEESSFCLRGRFHSIEQTFASSAHRGCLLDSFEHGHSHRISIKPPAFVHQASVAEITTGDHKSTSSARRSSTTFAPETHHHENEKVNRLFSLITKGTGSHTSQESANRKKSSGFYPNSSCVSEPNGAWGHFADKKKKLFTVRPGINALRRLNQSKQVHQVDQPKLPSHANRIDYMSTVRTRFKLISSKKLSLKPINKAIEPARRVDIHRSSEIDGRRMSSVLFGTA
ncbi:hypothetical protein PtA15_6A551 [Puccinia triticina]|uniref:Uncharacterized protein n=1 Tax=Puccinia triticina TaxID=208348 RepID=A0ABY7CPK5_9BASI|nr:uncharacterized protein PtA15_6A551 [Puccinia triticina]WAQ85922.1 hypothetical protein PtA15_6A551 [Puccinia triticina]